METGCCQRPENLPVARGVQGHFHHEGPSGNLDGGTSGGFCATCPGESPYVNAGPTESQGPLSFCLLHGHLREQQGRHEAGKAISGRITHRLPHPPGPCCSTGTALPLLWWGLHTITCPTCVPPSRALPGTLLGSDHPQLQRRSTAPFSRLCGAFTPTGYSVVHAATLMTRPCRRGN